MSGALFSYVDGEARIAANHPLRAMRRLTNAALAELDARFSGLYQGIGRPSTPPERLLRASLLQLLYSLRSERQLIERLEFDMLFRWFVGLTIDERVLDASTFSKNRDRLLTHEIAQEFLSSLLGLPEVRGLLSAEHSSVGEGRSPPGEPRLRGRRRGRDFARPGDGTATHASMTDEDAGSFRKGAGQERRLAYLGRALMENRDGLAGGGRGDAGDWNGSSGALRPALAEGAEPRRRQGPRRRGFFEGLKARGSRIRSPTRGAGGFRRGRR